MVLILQPIAQIRHNFVLEIGFQQSSKEIFAFVNCDVLWDDINNEVGKSAQINNNRH